MASSSPTNDNALRVLQSTVSRGLATTQFEYLDVTFSETAHGDTEIRHNLRAGAPENVRAVPVVWRFMTPPLEAPYIYTDTSSTHRPWSLGTIILRCNLAAAQARLLLFAETT